MKRSKELRKIILVAIFSALCCACTFIQIKMPTGDFVHLGNFVMIISALLLGGIEGGLVGSIGMGLYDLLFYINKPSTIIRTIILKFIIGFTVGFLFRLIIKKDIKIKPLFISLASVFGVFFVGSLVLFILGDKSSFGAENNYAAVFANIFGSTSKLSISILIPIFTALFFALIIFALIFSKKLSTRSKAVLFAVNVALIINIIGEFLLRWFLEGIMVSNFDVSIIVATSKIPGSVITAFVSIFLTVLIYDPIYKSLSATCYIESFEENNKTETSKLATDAEVSVKTE